MSDLSALTAIRYLDGVRQLLAGRGIDASTLLLGTGISMAQLEDSNGYATASQLDRFLENAITASGDHSIGLTLGTQLNISAHGNAGFAGLTAANGHSALDVAIRYFPLVTQLLQLHLSESREFITIEAETLPEQTSRCEQFVLQTLISSIVLMARFLLGPHATSIRIDVAWGPQPEMLALFSDLSETVRFHAPGYRIRLPRAILDTPFVLANAQSHQRAIAACDGELQRLHRYGGFSARLYHQLLVSREALPSIEQIAEQLQVSSRTVHRLLEAEGNRFRDLLNQARISKAKRLLSDKNLNVTDTAHALGYSDSANFSRAFRRHTGITPKDFIRQQKIDGTVVP